jgi:hypothetical protein
MIFGCIASARAIATLCEPLAIIEHGLDVISPLGVAGGCPGDGARKHVHFTGLDRGPTFGCRDKANLDGFGIAQHRCGHGTAQVYVKAHIVSGCVQRTVAGDIVPAGADDLAPRLNNIQAARSGFLHLNLFDYLNFFNHLYFLNHLYFIVARSQDHRKSIYRYKA